MVSNASALGRNGIHDWLLLRAAAILITLYILYILGFVVMTGTLTYDVWHGFFSSAFSSSITPQSLPFAANSVGRADRL